ncbi:unnamed protein product [Durusdinium trenchii]|uniref:SET domain-containing protein n=2 Tax=Durusdinium trenchii TaxID=1381693 RepID=A0ABP0K7W4_9DINO
MKRAMSESRETTPRAAPLKAPAQQTEEALASLRQHWQSEPLAEALNTLDATELGPEGQRWSRAVGLHFPTPASAIRGVQPLAGNEYADGLRAPSAAVAMPSMSSALLVAPAPPCGHGVFAMRPLQAGQRLGEYTGEARRYDLWCEEIKARKVARRGAESSASPFILEELYAAWAGIGGGEGVVIDAFAKGNAMRFINCSCQPNCSFKNVGAGFEKHGRLLVVTSRDIEAFEQLSVDYGWYFDPATLAEVRAEATKAYNEDLSHLQALSKSRASVSASSSVRILQDVLQEVPGPTEFLRRYVDRAQLTRLVESKKSFSQAKSYLEIPEALWHFYEVLGADRVGISCRCALDKSLNATGLCSGIIGRPLQATHLGREKQ